MEFTFTLTEEEANFILAGLQELPARIANPLSQKLREQAQAQVPTNEKTLDLSSGVSAQESFA